MPIFSRMSCASAPCASLLSCFTHRLNLVGVLVYALPHKRTSRSPRSPQLVPHSDIGDVNTVLVSGGAGLKADLDLELLQLLNLTEEPPPLWGNSVMAAHYLASPDDMIGTMTIRKSVLYCVPYAVSVSSASSSSMDTLFLKLMEVSPSE